MKTKESGNNLFRRWNEVNIFTKLNLIFGIIGIIFIIGSYLFHEKPLRTVGIMIIVLVQTPMMMLGQAKDIEQRYSKNK